MNKNSSEKPISLVGIKKVFLLLRYTFYTILKQKRPSPCIFKALKKFFIFLSLEIKKIFFTAVYDFPYLLITLVSSVSVQWLFINGCLSIYEIKLSSSFMSLLLYSAYFLVSLCLFSKTVQI